MSWTSPITWTAALVTVAQFNEQIRDNMNALKAPPGANASNGGGDYTVSGTSFANVDSGDDEGELKHTVVVAGTVVEVGFLASVRPNAASERRLYFNISVDGTDYFADDGIAEVGNGAVTASDAAVYVVSFVVRLTVAAGSRIIRLRAKVNAGSYLIYAGATSNYGTKNQFWVKERG